MSKKVKINENAPKFDKIEEKEPEISQKSIENLEKSDQIKPKSILKKPQNDNIELESSLQLKEGSFEQFQKDIDRFQVLKIMKESQIKTQKTEESNTKNTP